MWPGRKRQLSIHLASPQVLSILLVSPSVPAHACRAVAGQFDSAASWQASLANLASSLPFSMNVRNFARLRGSSVFLCLVKKAKKKGREKIHQQSFAYSMMENNIRVSRPAYILDQERSMTRKDKRSTHGPGVY